MVAVADRSNQPIFAQYASPTDWPWTLTTMVGEARRIIGYYELPDKYRPPKSLWHSANKCSDYIEKAMNDGVNGDNNSLDFNDSELA